MRRLSWVVLAALAALPATLAAAPDTPAPVVSLAESVRQALVHNPTAAIAEAEIRRAVGLLHEARAASLPTLNGVLTYTRLDGPRSSAGYAADELNGTLALSVPLVTPPNWARWRHARDNVKVAWRSAADLKRQVAAATARAYLSVVSMRRVVEVTIRARDTARAHFEFAAARRRGGVGNRLDEVRAQQEQATDEVQVQVQQTALLRAREALGVLMGTSGPIDADVEAVIPAAPSQAVAERDVEVRRTDVLVAAETVTAALHVSRDSWTDYMPQLLATFSPFFQYPPEPVYPATGYIAQVVLSVPFYDGGYRYGAARERRALADEAQSRLDGTLRQARSEVRVAYQAVRLAEGGLRSARDAGRAAQEALDLANLAYRAGATTNLEVIDAERAARDAETAVAVAEDTARQANLDLVIASGDFP